MIVNMNITSTSSTAVPYAYAQKGISMRLKDREDSVVTLLVTFFLTGMFLVYVCLCCHVWGIHTRIYHLFRYLGQGRDGRDEDAANRPVSIRMSEGQLQYLSPPPRYSTLNESLPSYSCAVKRMLQHNKGPMRLRFLVYTGSNSIGNNSVFSSHTPSQNTDVPESSEAPYDRNGNWYSSLSPNLQFHIADNSTSSSSGSNSNGSVIFNATNKYSDELGTQSPYSTHSYDSFIRKNNSTPRTRGTTGIVQSSTPIGSSYGLPSIVITPNSPIRGKIASDCASTGNNFQQRLDAITDASAPSEEEDFPADTSRSDSGMTNSASTSTNLLTVPSVSLSSIPSGSTISTQSETVASTSATPDCRQNESVQYQCPPLMPSKRPCNRKLCGNVTAGTGSHLCGSISKDSACFSEDMIPPESVLPKNNIVLLMKGIGGTEKVVHAQKCAPNCFEALWPILSTEIIGSQGLEVLVNGPAEDVYLELLNMEGLSLGIAQLLPSPRRTTKDQMNLHACNILSTPQMLTPTPEGYRSTLEPLPPAYHT